MTTIGIQIADDKTCSVLALNSFGNPLKRVDGLTPEQATRVKDLLRFVESDARADERDKIRDSI